MTGDGRMKCALAVKERQLSDWPAVQRIPVTVQLPKQRAGRLASTAGLFCSTSTAEAALPELGSPQPASN